MLNIMLFALLAVQQFHAEDPVKRDNDSVVDVTGIEKRRLNDTNDFIQHSVSKAGERSGAAAINVNTIGNVPDSSWFQNRHGATRLTIGDLVRGPGAGGPAQGIWEVIAGKTEGVTPGFRIRDTRGDVYFVKFDPPGNPEMATAAEVISTRFFYAIGFNVPENNVAFITRDRLRVGADATLAEKGGRPRAMTERDLDDILKRVSRPSGGAYRVVVSKRISGTPVGPFQYFGVRPDDPNDIFPHEQRRELRGLRVFCAWLNHNDSRAINSLDLIVGQGRQYVKHYLIDFGSTLGSDAIGPKSSWAGWEYALDWKTAMARIATLGLWDHSWLHASYPDNPAVGHIESARFDPLRWKPSYPNPAFERMTDDDAYWAARIVMAFTDDDIRAIVSTGRFSDPKAETYLIATLIERRDKIGRAWLTRRPSFDEFEWTEQGLKFRHLASAYGFAPQPRFESDWFKFNNATAARTAVAGFHPEVDTGYFVAVFASGQGRVEAYLRNLNGKPEIVGVTRAARRTHE